MPLKIFGLLIGVFAVSWLLTGLIRRYALGHALLDHPNARSSHTHPTPTGGGAAIALSFFLAVGALHYWGMLNGDASWALLGGGVLVVFIGAWDDITPIVAKWRLLAHLLAALWAVYCIGAPVSLNLGIYTLELGWIAYPFWVLAVMWLTNLYNFMDGIDGLAGTQAITAGLAGGVLLWWLNAPGLAGASLALAAASGGFLIWNWPRARIFMGDAGSGMLGFSFAVLALAGERGHAMPAAVWVILLALFILDASYTLLARLLRGEAWYHAHRSHAYQRLVQAGIPHRRVTLWALLINVVVLWPATGIIWAYPGLLLWMLAVVAIAGWLLWWGMRSKFSNP